MDTNFVKTQIEKALPGIQLKRIRETLLIQNPQDLPKVADYLKNEASLKMDYLACVTGSDYLSYLESVYHLCSIEKKCGPLVLRVRVSRQSPRIPSLASIYRGAEFQEREAFDLFGIIYENHPDLRRILLWEGFEGYPMRKDYAEEDEDTLDAPDIEWLEEKGIRLRPENTEKK